MPYIVSKGISHTFLQAAPSFYMQDLGDADIVEICSKIRAKDNVVRPPCSVDTFIPPNVFLFQQIKIPPLPQLYHKNHLMKESLTTPLPGLHTRDCMLNYIIGVLF